MTDAPFATAVVVLRDGKRLGWKIVRGGGDTLPFTLNSKYFRGHNPEDCECVTERFNDPGAFTKAERWAAGFPSHPDETTGLKPSTTAAWEPGFSTCSTDKEGK